MGRAIGFTKAQRRSFAKKVVRFRTRNALTQKGLADLMGLTRQCIYWYEAEKRCPGAETVYRFRQLEKRAERGEL